MLFGIMPKIKQIREKDYVSEFFSLMKKLLKKILLSHLKNRNSPSGDTTTTTTATTTTLVCFFSVDHYCLLLRTKPQTKQLTCF